MKNQQKEFHVNQVQLPIKNIFLKSIDLVVLRRMDLLRLGLPLIIVGFISTVYSDSNYGNNFEELTVIERLLVFVHVVATLLATVGAHRVFLMPTNSARATPVIRWSMRETRFVGWWVLVGVAAGVYMIPFFVVYIISSQAFSLNIMEDYGTLAMMPAFYLVSRWALVLPATAIDQTGKTLDWAWALSKGNSGRLFFLTGIIPLLAGELLSLLAVEGNIFLGLFQNLVWIFIGAIEICLLSLSFNFLTKNTIANNGCVHDYKSVA